MLFGGREKEKERVVIVGGAAAAALSEQIWPIKDWLADWVAIFARRLVTLTLNGSHVVFIGEISDYLQSLAYSYK